MIAANQRPSRAKQWLGDYGPAAAAYCLLTLFTQAHFTGDAPDYVDSIVAYDRGQYYEFWEFGHVLWRPLGWILLTATRPLLLSLSGGDLEAGAMLVLIGLSWIAGLVSVIALAAIVRRFCSSRLIITVTALALITSHAFLNFAQTGSSYIASLCSMLLALNVLMRPPAEPLSMRRAVTAGLFIALMICFWLPFIVVVPAMLIAPLAFATRDRTLWRMVIATALVAGALTAGIYLAVAAGPVGVRNASGFRAWMQQTTGKTAQDKGLARTGLGFARSFIHTGNDGMLFKRYLVRDPFNPVSAFDLLRLSLWKLILFYLFLLAIGLNLLRSETGKRLLIPLGLAAITVVGVGVYWQGGDIERYLPLYPMLFVAVACVLCSKRSARVLNYLVLVFLGAAAITNLYAMSPPVLAAQQAKALARVSAVAPHLKPASRVFVINFQDDLYSFQRNFPFNPIVRSDTLKVRSLIEVSGKDAPQWRKVFAAQAQSAWNEGGDVWVTSRVLRARPKADWNWVEGDDKRLSWNDVHQFFSQLDLGEPVGGEDGFVLVLPSAKTKLILDQSS